MPGSGNSVTWPSVVIRPMRSAAVSVNHSAPSGPAAMPNGPQSGVGSANSCTLPSVVIRPMRCARYSVNQSASSGPAAMIVGPQPGSSRWRVGSPPGTNRPISPLWTIVNHSAPSGPVVTAYGPLPASATTYSRMTTAVMRCAPVRRSGRWNIMMAS